MGHDYFDGRKVYVIPEPSDITNPSTSVPSPAALKKSGPTATVDVVRATTTAPDIDVEEETSTDESLDPGYLVICWDDPVNLMEYVTHVFRTVFGWPREKAEQHMLEVHHQGKSVLIRETLERAEHYVHQLRKYRLHATMENGE